MHFKHLSAILAIGFGCLLSSCHSDIDLQNVDTSMETRLKLALPIGSFKAKVSDFLGSGDSVQIYVDENGVVTWKQDIHKQPEIPQEDLGKNIKDNDFFINLYKRLKDATYTDGSGVEHPIIQYGNKIILPPGQETYRDSIVFSMPLNFENLNVPGSDRVDSAYLSTANFDVTISKKDFDDLQWDWIDQIVIDMGEHLDRRGQPSRYALYTRGVSTVTDYGQTMPMDLSNITMHLTKNRHDAPSMDNVVDSLDIRTIVYYHIPSPTTADIYSTSGIDCNFAKRQVDVDVVWGWFSSASSLSVQGSFNLDSLMDFSKLLREANIPLQAPQIEMELTTSVAGDAKLKGSFSSIDKDNNTHYALFDGQDHFDWRFHGIDPGDNRTLGDSTKVHLLFDNTSEHGEINRLFTSFPRKLAYDINFNMDEESTPQIRIPTDLFVNVDGSITLPFAFDKGLKIELQDTIRDVNISGYQIDSLLSDVKAIDSVRVSDEGVWLLLTIYDSIPADIYATLTCLDEFNRPIEDPEIPKRKFILFPDAENDTIRIPALTEKGALLRCQLTQKRLNLFPKIKSIAYTVGITDAAASASGTVIRGDNSIRIQMGLTADIKAYMNINNLK